MADLLLHWIIQYLKVAAAISGVAPPLMLAIALHSAWRQRKGAKASKEPQVCDTPQ